MKSARTAQRIYPNIIPNKIDAELKIPFAKCFAIIINANTARPISRLVGEPKSLLAFPPPNEFIPTLISDKPIAVTTVPVTTLGKNLRSGLSRKPRIISNIPPMKQAPRIAPYAITPPALIRLKY